MMYIIFPLFFSHLATRQSPVVPPTQLEQGSSAAAVVAAMNKKTFTKTTSVLMMALDVCKSIQAFQFLILLKSGTRREASVCVFLALLARF